MKQLTTLQFFLFFLPFINLHQRQLVVKLGKKDKVEVLLIQILATFACSVFRTILYRIRYYIRSDVSNYLSNY